jgi:hypothetical protein
MGKRGRWPGTWRAICDRCGVEFASDQLIEDWQGHRVCKKDFETRHPQDFVRGVPDDPTVPWSRPEGPDTFAAYCTLASSSGYTGLAKAGCMIAGDNTRAATFLRETFIDDYE